MPYAKGCKPGDSKKGSGKKLPKLPEPVKIPTPIKFLGWSGGLMIFSDSPLLVKNNS
jgi:hypothetical protein